MTFRGLPREGSVPRAGELQRRGVIWIERLAEA